MPTGEANAGPEQGSSGSEPTMRQDSCRPVRKATPRLAPGLHQGSEVLVSAEISKWAPLCYKNLKQVVCAHIWRMQGGLSTSDQRESSQTGGAGTLGAACPCRPRTPRSCPLRAVL